MLLQSSEMNCHELRLVIYIEILILAILFPKDQKKLSIAF